MMPLFMPPQIEIVETVAAEFYADGATFQDRGEVMTGIYYVERTIGGITALHEVCRIHYPRSRWLTSWDRTARAIRGCGSGH